MIVSITSGRPGPRPRQVRPRPKAPFPMVKSPNFYKIIYIYLFKCYAFFFISDVKDTTNFTTCL